VGSPKRPPAPQGAPGSEDAAVEGLAGTLSTAFGPAPPGQIWIGDDAAILPSPPGRLVLATDAVVEGVHVDLGLVAPSDAGWKAVASTLSDIGAMGARPLYSLVSVCTPAAADLDAVMAGVAEASVEWRCPVVGGDLSSARALVVTVAVAGVLDGPEPAITRAGAAPGDTLCVTGPLGSSAAGLRLLRSIAAGDRPVGDDPVAERLVGAHRRPRALLVEGAAARSAAAAAMIDVSDGLAIDLHRLADASGVGFSLDRVPVAPGATLAEALGGGEDYELVIATPAPDRLDAALVAAGAPPSIRIGRCVADRAERKLEGAPLARLGWEHRFGE